MACKNKERFLSEVAHYLNNLARRKVLILFASVDMLRRECIVGFRRCKPMAKQISACGDSDKLLISTESFRVFGGYCCLAILMLIGRAWRA